MQLFNKRFNKVNKQYFASLYSDVPKRMEETFLMRILVIGVSGLLGQALMNIFKVEETKGTYYQHSNKQKDMMYLDITTGKDVTKLIQKIRPNNYGPYQYPEKLIPFFIIHALKNEYLPANPDGLNVRDWLYVDDNCRAIDLVRIKGKTGEIYNIGADNEHSNIEITRIILEELHKPQSLIKYVKDRLGHDRRYCINSEKIKKLGWYPNQSKDFISTIKKSIQWYISNEIWWKKLID